ncbi:glycoside hydrolase family 88 protein [Prevotella sp. 10(H)]|uniref:glycoside hydrolase family 88 protein n=1 Tax=Prevotella sp. 10(H) TaxID=1158294 RepID=UPI0004A74D97|nr:glycoside hydrolase family 88 protein [Prevotella sp. 10(H)]
MKIFLRLIFISAFAIIVATSCNGKKEIKQFISENIDFATRQTSDMLKNIGDPTGKNYPHSIDSDGKVITRNRDSWTSGFFPGSLWHLYELTNDSVWKNEAEKWTISQEPLKTFTKHHDIGLMIYYSYGNALRLAPKDEYKDIIIQSAYSLATRYNDTVKAIKSWDYHKSWDGEESHYPVSIDNMLNLELLLEASKLSGDKRLKEIAINHANTTLKNHFREDFCSYHVICYDSITGGVLHRASSKGLSNNSAWARGQAWAAYGFAMMYNETKNQTYLDAATKIMNFYIKHLPEDLIPVWDLNFGQKSYVPKGDSTNKIKFATNLKDASAAAIACSALFDLGKYTKNEDYTEIAIKMLKNLASSEYRAQSGTNGDFLLMHCVGNIPNHAEIDVPLVYADYYFLESLVKYKKIVG